MPSVTLEIGKAAASLWTASLGNTWKPVAGLPVLVFSALPARCWTVRVISGTGAAGAGDQRAEIVDRLCAHSKQQGMGISVGDQFGAGGGLVDVVGQRYVPGTRPRLTTVGFSVRYS